VRVRAARSGQPVWDAEALERTAGYLRAWVADVNGGAAADRSFAERTLVQPPARLLATKRILFARVPFSDYFALPDEKRKDFDFR
jgi:hypothetical protein